MRLPIDGHEPFRRIAKFPRVFFATDILLFLLASSFLKASSCPYYCMEPVIGDFSLPVPSIAYMRAL
jgi:hypothetical protein